MSRLEIRLLGSFEVRRGNERVTGFESQKVRALLAHLIMHRDKAHSRERLSGLLWPERDDNTARRNLRQAIYNLRTALLSDDMPAPPITTTHHTIRFNPEADYWLDVAAFEDGVHRGMSSRNGDPYHLAGASDLYRGDFLAGFYVKDSAEFEHWLLYEQERLREMVIQALRRLVDHYLTSHVYYLGVRYARQLLEIDPLFEEAHRNLMRLYALSGRRSHALEQYEECRELLRTELGVEPLEETSNLYRAILAEEWPARSVSSQEEEPAGPPRLPLVGRDEAYTRLQRSWEAAREGRGWLTLVEGEAGIGKTRLVEEFIQSTVQSTAAQSDAVVLNGSCYDFASPMAYQPIVEALRLAVKDRAHFMAQVLDRASPDLLATLVGILPELRALRPGVKSRGASSRVNSRRDLIEAIVAFLKLLAVPSEPSDSARPLVLFLDDVHWSDRSTLELLNYLIRHPAEVPMWVVAAYRPDELAPDHPLRSLRQQLRRDRGVDRIALDRLSPSAIEQMALALVRDDQAGLLAEFLDRESAGLPRALAELIAYLCEEGILAPRDAGRWGLADTLPALAMPTPENLRDLTLWRVSQLPTSARRLLTLAAVIGPRFDAELLQVIEGEHMAVVEAGLELWLARHFVKQASSLSIDAGRGAAKPRGDVTQWGTFQFIHDQMRLTLYHDVSPVRRKVMHRQVATALEKHYADDSNRMCEALAHHYAEAHAWEKALRYLSTAADKTRQAKANDVALYYYDRALDVLDRLEERSDGRTDRQDWLEDRFDLLAARSEVYNGQDRSGDHQADLDHMRDIAQQLGDPDQFMLVIDQLGHSGEQ